MHSQTMTLSMKLIIILLIACSVFTISLAVNERSLQSRIFQHQKEIGKLLDYFIDITHEIQVGEIELELTIKENNKPVQTLPEQIYELYKFDGEDVKSMPLKGIFEMMQSWNNYLEKKAENLPDTERADFIKQRRFFQMNIGGEEAIFGIYVNVDNKQLMICNEKGQDFMYKKMFQVFEKHKSEVTFEQIANKIISSVDRPLNDQPNWNVQEIGELHKNNLGESMTMFAVISQVAEGARPTEAFFRTLETEFDNTHEKLIEDENMKDWKNDFKKELKNLLYETDKITQHDEYFNFFDNLREFIDINTNDERKEAIIRSISDNLPLHIDEFYDLLIEKKNNANAEGELKTFLENKKFDVTDSEYSEADLVSSITELENFLNQESTEQQKTDAKISIEKNLPIVTENFCKDLYDAVRKKFAKLAHTVARLSEQLDTTLNNNPSGRLSGAGVVARGLLKKFSEGRITSFEEFNRLFILSQRKGIKRSHDYRFQYSTRPEEEYESDFTEMFQWINEQTQQRQRLDLQATAAADATMKQAEKELSQLSCDKKRRKRSSEACGKVKLVEDSIKWEGDVIEFETINNEGIKEEHEMKIPLNEMASNKFFQEKTSRMAEFSQKFGVGMGIYGTLASAAGSIEQFMNGNYGQGALSAAQTLHSIGGLTGINEKMQKFIVRKSLDFAAEKFGFEKMAEKLSEPLAEGLGKAGKVFSRFLGDVPFVGLGFDIYFITEDVKDLENKNSTTPEFLKVAHLILDIETTVLSLVETIAPEAEPFIEPLVIALSIIRMTIDDFYTDIKGELDKVKGASFGTKVVAFLKGFGEGIADVFTLGMVNQINQLDEEKENDKQLFKNMSNPELYFNTTKAEKGNLDFNGNYMSQFGGFLTVTLHNDGSFSMELPEVYTGENPISIKTKNMKYDKPAKDIVMGIGTVASPAYRHVEAKLWLLIPVKSYDLVSKFWKHNSSRYGTYYGNDLNNNFYAIQNDTPSHSAIQENLSVCKSFFYSQFISQSMLGNYHYDLYGQGGDDKFFLGPQTVNVLGNDGKDLYFIPPTGGKTVIYNFALDEKQDTLYMNLSYSDLYCYRQDEDLVVHYCDSHVAILKQWFIHASGKEKYYRHITIITNDEIVIDVTDTSTSGDQYETICNPVSIDKSRAKKGVNIDLLSSDQFLEVTRVVGTNYSDTILGNKKDNMFIGGLDNDKLSGKEGKDVYVIREGDGVDTIDNYATDKQNDTILFGVDYDSIVVERQLNDLVLYQSEKPLNTRVIMQSWFKGIDNQHATFVSKEYITFVIATSDNNVRKNAVTIDLSKSKQGITLNLQDNSLNKGIQIDKEGMHDVQLVFDSPHDDHIVGNVRNNIMTCSGGADYLQGNNGSDTYIVKQTCEYLEIFNEDEFKQYDLMLLNCSSSAIKMYISGDDLIVKCFLKDQLQVKLIDWFKSPVNQHLMIKTLDQWTFLPPEKTEHFHSNIMPYQIETTEDCSGQVRHFDFSKEPFLEVERFQAKSSKCRYNVIGNSLNNYIDPGPSDSYGYQTLRGGNGSDTYVFGHNYGTDNAINNYATDEEYDHLLFHVIYSNIHMIQRDNDIVISSVSPNNSVNVTIINYVSGKKYQHLLIHSSDGVIFQIRINEFAITKQILAVDYSKSKYSQIISTATNPSLANVRAIFGSNTAVNSIVGGNETMKIVGGVKNDNIIGGSLSIGEDIIGLDGNDYIDGREGDDNIMGGDGNDTLLGGDGNDAIYGGKGADVINGGNGSDTIVFSGNGTTSSGVMVNLVIGKGWYADAEGDTYKSIENVLGSEFNDSIIGNDNDNILRGSGGEDYIVPGGGTDVLEGGLDADIYDMKNAYGFKLINNFATDTSVDTFFFPNATVDQMCYFFIEGNLHIAINYSNSSVTGAVRRVVLGEGYLEIKLLFWLLNETYRHVDLMLSDTKISPEKDFSQHNHQMQWIFDEMVKGKFYEITSVTESSLTLHFSFTSINKTVPLPSNTELYYSHISLNYSNTQPLNISGSNGNKIVNIWDLKAGVEQYFSVVIVSCDVKAAISPLISVTTLPNPPINVEVSTRANDGFKIEWTPPDNTTDTNAFYYNYTIKYWIKDLPIDVHTIHFSNQFLFEYTASKLAPGTHYLVKIASTIYDTVGSFTPPVEVKTGLTACVNFLILPSHMHISNMKSNSHGHLQAYLFCDKNYKLTGDKYLLCDGIPHQQPKCKLITCPIPSVGSINAFPISSFAYYIINGVSVLWKCSKNYETKQASHEFNSICDNGQWSPTLQQACVLSPACPNYPPLENGKVTPEFAYRDETISLECDNYYSRIGPDHKVCVIEESLLQSVPESNSRFGYYNQYASIRLQPASPSDYRPTTEVKCVKYSCPKLLEQPHGHYSQSKNFQSGDIVTLTCDIGYFVRDDYHHPELETLTCSSHGTWNVEQKLCQPILKSKSDTETKFYQVIGYLEYTVPKWKHSQILSSVYHQIACDVMGGYRYVSSLGMVVTCSLNYQLYQGDGSINKYEGLLSIVHPDGNVEIVCVTEQTNAQFVCTKLGYGEYTASIDDIKTITTTKALVINFFNYNIGWMIGKTQQCSKGISCRTTCPQLFLETAINRCYNTLEGETCSFKCSPGSALLGSQTRTCQGNGDWSGDQNYCDADKWKADILSQAKEYSDYSYQDLASKMGNYLTTNYPDVTWVVIIYKDITGYDCHTVTKDAQYVYSYFRYYGHNIVVGRLLTPYNGENPGLETKLDNSFSPKCHKYCHDPACWSHSSGIDAEKTWDATWDELSDNGVDITMLYVLQGGYGYGYSTFAGRRDSNSGHFYSTAPFYDTLDWDKRVVAKTLSMDGCRTVFTVLMGSS